MNKDIQTAIKYRLGKSLKPDFSELNIGKYSFSPLPSEIFEGFETELLFYFFFNFYWKIYTDECSHFISAQLPQCCNLLCLREI